ncbi:MAG TPA: hypothetical protein VJO16_06640 [Candidatus Acidoferrum sp.]|nr:hypothetical protein [Candidatus Acidoferrum sp.]
MAILFVVPVSRAQEQSGQQSTSADKPIDSRTDVTPNKGKAQDSDNDLGNRSMSGAFDSSLSNVEGRRSYWQPLVNVTSIIDNDPLTASQTSGVTSWSAVYGGINLYRLTRQSDLTLSYLGGGLISNDGKTNNSALQQFEFGDRVRLGRRSVLSFFDLLNELPEISFGFSLPLAVNLPEGQGLSLQSVFSPNQSILTTRGERIGNVSVAEFDRELTAKSSLTFVGGYSLLRFLNNSGLLNDGEVTLQGGFDHQLTRGRTIGALYRFNELRFEGIGQPIDAHTGQLFYGQRIAERLALRLAAGPAISVFRTAVSPGTTGSATRSTSQVYWTLDASISYQQRREMLGLAYDHSLSGGGGVLPGAITDQLSGSLTSQFSKALSSELTVGYARNHGLNTPLTPLQGTGQVYNYWFGGVQLSYAWGRWTSLNLSYQAQSQDSNVNSCIGAICGRNIVRQTGSVGLTWRPRPMVIR